MRLPYDTQDLVVEALERQEAQDRFREFPAKQNNGRFYTALQNRPNWPVVLAEGDSWFDYQHVAEDIIYHLGGRTYGCAIRCVADHGHELAWMVEKEEWIQAMKGPFLRDLEYVLFSGGGDDLLHEKPFESFLLDKAAPENEGRSGLDLIKQDVLNGLIDGIKQNYERVIERTLEVKGEAGIQNDVYVLAHGYDYAVPDGRGVSPYGILNVGPWLTKVMVDTKHIEELSERQLIVNQVIDKLNAMLKGLAEAADPFVWIDLRKTLAGRNDWNDEIHPTTTGAKKLAGKIMHVINYIEGQVRQVR